MALKQQLQEDLKAAMRQRDERRMSVLRLALAAISNEEIRLGKQAQGLDDSEILTSLKKQVKQRNDALEIYLKSGEKERVEQEEQEKKILESYLPVQASLQEIEAAVEAAIAHHPNPAAKDFGAIMKDAMTRCSGNADGKAMSEIIKKRLS